MTVTVTLFTLILTIVHEQIEGEVLNEELAVELERLAIQSMQHGVASAVSSGSTSVGLTA